MVLPLAVEFLAGAYRMAEGKSGESGLALIPIRRGRGCPHTLSCQAAECFELLGIATPESRSEKLQRAVSVKDSLFALADEIVDRLPDDLTTTAATA